MRGTIEKRGDDWLVKVQSNVYRVTSINDFGRSKLESMLERGGDVGVVFEPITEYYSHEYRTCILPDPQGVGFLGGMSAMGDDAVACLMEDYVDDAEVDAYEQELIDRCNQPFIPFPEV